MLKLKNDGGTVLVADINNSETLITVVDGSVFPEIDAAGEWFPLTLIKDSSVERMQVIARLGSTLTVIRGTEGTIAKAWAAGDSCTCNLTEAAINGVSAYALAEISGGTVINRKDYNGNNNIMLRVPMFTLDVVNETLGTSLGSGPHPAFLRPDGSVRTHFEYGCYVASNDGRGNPVSAPNKDPYTSVSHDSSKQKCESMGSGWHLASNAEWAAIYWLCEMNGWSPTGNTNYGRSHSKKIETAIRQDGAQPGDVSGAARVLTGSGPVAWRHNGELAGIDGMVGNVWEWQDGMKQVNGQIFVAETNGAAEQDWVAQAAYYDGSGMLAPGKSSGNAGISTLWASQQKDELYSSNELLKALLIEPDDGSVGADGRLYCNNTITGFPMRGGHWGHGSTAGLGALLINNTRTHTNYFFGFRPAFFE